MTVTRRERQRLANREAILQATLSVAEREGWPAVTIRRIAEEIEYTSPIIYQHFDNKEAALHVLLERGYADLQDVMARAVQASSLEQLPISLGLAYLGFAQEHPKLYELMNGLGGVVIDGRLRQNAARGVTAVTTRGLETWAAHRGVHLSDPVMACETAWGVMHGMASLGMLEDIGFERAQILAIGTIKALMESWGAS